MPIDRWIQGDHPEKTDEAYRTAESKPLRGLCEEVAAEIDRLRAKYPPGCNAEYLAYSDAMAGLQYVRALFSVVDNGARAVRRRG